MDSIDMDAYKVNEIIKNNHRFISPFNDPYGYYIWIDGNVNENIIELYWKQLEYAERNIDRLIQQAFNFSFYEFYGVNQKIVKSPADMCQRLIIESFVLFQGDDTTISCCLSNDEFMFGHYIEFKWDCGWNLIDSYIC